MKFTVVRHNTMTDMFPITDGETKIEPARTKDGGVFNNMKSL